MDKKILVIMLMMVIAISACPQSSADFNPNAGIVLQDLSFDVPEVYDDGDKATLMFDVVNVGGKEIEEGETVNVYVYGPAIATSGSGVWMVKTTDTVSNDYISKAISEIELPPPNPSLGIPGGRRSYDYLFTPPKVLNGMKIPTKFYVSVCYPYTTQTLTQVEVSSKNELRATGVRGSRKDTVNAGGPIHITLQGNTGIRPGSSIPLVFKVTDVGRGYSSLQGDCKVDLPKSDRDEVTVKVSVDGDTSSVTCGSTDTVKLRKGAGALFCTYTPSSASVVPKRTYMVTAIAEYNYYVTSTVSITTVGTGGSTDSEPE